MNCLTKIFFLSVVLLVFSDSVRAQDSLNVDLVSSVYNYWHTGISLHLQDDLAFISTGQTGLKIVDISDPSEPCEIATYMWENDEHVGGSDMKIVGNTAFVRASGGYRILDVSDPASIRQINFLEYSRLSRIFEVSENYLCLFFENVGVYPKIRIFDVSDPENIDETGFYNGMRVNRMALNGDIAFCSGLHFDAVDFSSPDSAQRLSRMDFDDLEIDEIRCADDYVYLTGSNKFVVIDASDPANMARLDDIDLNRNPSDLIIEGDYAYLLESPRDTLTILNISDPESLYVETTLEFESTNRQTVKYGDYFYGLNQNFPRLSIYRCNDLESLTRISSTEHLGWICDVVVRGNLAYTLLSIFGLGIVDISDPANPIRLSELRIDNFSIFNKMDLSNGHIFLPSTDEGIYVIDVTDPNAPVLVNVIEESRGQTVKCYGNIAFAACGREGMDIIDISDPPNPELLGHWENEGSTELVAATWDLRYAYVSQDFNLSDSIIVLDISDIRNPVQVNSQRVYGSWLDTGEEFLASSSGRSLHSLENGENIPVIAEFSHRQSVRELVNYQDMYLFAASYDSGLMILEVCEDDTGAFTLAKAGQFDSEGLTCGLDVSANLVLLADKYSLKLLRFNRPDFIEPGNTAVIEDFQLFGAFPNPFNSTTTITFTLPVQSRTHLNIYDTSGRLVDTLLDRVTPAGMHAVVWDGGGLAAGVYVVKLSDESGSLSLSQKAVIVK